MARNLGPGPSARAGAARRTFCAHLHVPPKAAYTLHAFTLKVCRPLSGRDGRATHAFHIYLQGKYMPRKAWAPERWIHLDPENNKLSPFRYDPIDIIAFYGMLGAAEGVPDPAPVCRLRAEEGKVARSRGPRSRENREP